jgi:hypothetical protein
VEDHVRRLLLGSRGLEAPLLERLVQGIVGLDWLRGRCAQVELGEEAAGLAGPRDGQVPLGTREPDVEQSPLLGEGRLRLRELGGKLALLEARQEDGLEFEPLRAVVRQQVDASPGPRAEALLEVRDELDRVALELLGELDEPGKVVLARDLALAEAVRDPVQQREAGRAAP